MYLNSSSNPLFTRSPPLLKYHTPQTFLLEIHGSKRPLERTPLELVVSVPLRVMSVFNVEIELTALKLNVLRYLKSHYLS